MKSCSCSAFALAAMIIAALAPSGADAAAGSPSGPRVDLSNVKLPEAVGNLGQSPLLTAFGAKCDGASDDAAAFSAAVAWLAAQPNRLVRLPAAICATSQTVTLGDGRQRSTTLSAGLAGGETSVPVASCTGIQSGDGLAIVADSGTVYRVTATGACSAGAVPTEVYGGTAAASGNTVYAGADSTLHGGGFAGFGSGATVGEFSGGPQVSTIKYIGTAAPTTTITATVSSGQTLTVASIADIAIGDVLGLVLDNGQTFWTTAAETPTGTTVKIANEVPSAATSGNALTVANNPVVRIAGPISSPRLEGVRLDANGLAAIGLDAMHVLGGKFRGPRGVLATGYTAVGFFLHSQEAYLQTAAGSTDSDYEISTFLPDNAHTIGCWLRGSAAGNVAYSRNRFFGGMCTMGGAEQTAAGLRTEYADNNVWLKPYTSFNGANNSGAGLLRQMVPNKDGLGSNVYVGAAFKGNVAEVAATGGTLNWDHFPGYATDDGEAVPTGKETGVTAKGIRFPLNTINTLAGAATGTASTAAFKMMGYGSTATFTPKTSGRVLISVTGNIRNNTAGDGGFVKTHFGTGAAPANGDAVAGTGCNGSFSVLGRSYAIDARLPFSITCIVSNLTVGTAYWLDLAIQAYLGGTATPENVVFTAAEL